MRFESDAESLDADGRLAVKVHARMPDTRVIAFCNEPRKKMHRSIGGTHATRIEDAPRFVWLARFRTHDDSEACRLEIEHFLKYRHTTEPQD